MQKHHNQLQQSDNTIKTAIEKYRAKLSETGKTKETNIMKNKLQAFTACGLSYRNTKPENIEIYKGHIIIDIDDVTPEDIQNIQDNIYKYDDVVLAFVSPSNNGYKIIHSTNYVETEGVSVADYHLSAFYHYENFYKNTFNVKIDGACKDHSRLSYISHDPNCYYNPNYSSIDITVLDHSSLKTNKVKAACKSLPIKVNTKNLIHKDDILIPASYEYYGLQSTLDPKDAENVLSIIHEYLDKSKSNIVSSYEDWIKVCFALRYILDDKAALEWFKKFSQQDISNYNDSDCEDQFNACVQETEREKQCTMGTIVHLAKEKGFDLSDKRLKKVKTIIENDQIVYSLVKNNLKVRYNCLEDCIEYNIDKNIKFKYDNDNEISYWKPLSDVDVDVLRYTIFNGASKDNIVSKLNFIAPSYNIIDVLKNDMMTYDIDETKDYVKELAETIESEDTPRDLIELYLKKWIVGMIAGLFNPMRNQNEVILTFQGSQGKGKSRWAYKFLPEKYRSLLLNKNIDLKNKDDKIELSKRLIIFMDEMDSVINNRSSVEVLKATTSLRKVEERRAYARIADKKDKICSFMGALNESEFLRDTTGNRRFFIIQIEKFHHDHNLDMMKVFAYCYKLYKNDYQFWMDEKEQALNEENNLSYEIQTDEELYIKKYLKYSEDSFLTATEIKTGINERLKTFSDHLKFTNNLGKYIKKCGFKQICKRIDGTPRKGYYLEFRDECNDTENVKVETRSYKNNDPFTI